jgi:hypothetical protein
LAIVEGTYPNNMSDEKVNSRFFLISVYLVSVDRSKKFFEIIKLSAFCLPIFGQV